MISIGAPLMVDVGCEPAPSWAIPTNRAANPSTRGSYGFRSGRV